MLTQAKAMFLYEVDNTLLDNARFAAEIGSSNELELRHDGSTNTLIHPYHRLWSPGA